MDEAKNGSPLRPALAADPALDPQPPAAASMPSPGILDRLRVKTEMEARELEARNDHQAQGSQPLVASIGTLDRERPELKARELAATAEGLPVVYDRRQKKVTRNVVERISV
jgi:hypothetical protein